jgi:hypothetical protein
MAISRLLNSQPNLTDNAVKQSKHEIDIFKQFIKIANLPIDAASVEKCNPPAPDILCMHLTEGPLAFELVELIDNSFSTRLGRQSTIEERLEKAPRKLSDVAQRQFYQRFENANLYLKLRPGATKNKVDAILISLFDELSTLPNTFCGNIRHFKSNLIANVIESIAVSRGQFQGPVFSIECVGQIGASLVPRIKDKLIKNYKSEYPIELVGYLGITGMFPEQLWQGRANSFFANVSDFGPFRKIWIMDLRKEIVTSFHKVIR